jgi:hypothetical protein
LKNAFDSIKKAITDNSTELQPFYDALAKVWDFIKKYLAPLLGGAFKTALEGVGTIVGGLVTGFSKLVGFISSTVTKIKEFVNFIKDNPITRFFFGGGGASGASLTTGGDSQGLVFGGEDGSGGQITSGGFQTGTPTSIFAPNPNSPTFTGAPIEAYSPAMQAAILRREELKAETERLRQAREDKAAARAAATGGLSTADRITINVNSPSVIDEEGFSRAVVDALNNSTFRGTNGATNFVSA